MILLCGDIGASNSRLAVINTSTQKLLAKEFFRNGDFKDFQSTLTAFRQTFSFELDGACFGVAGPVIDGCVEITNLPWVIKEAELAKFLKVQRCHLVNDLESIAYGLKKTNAVHKILDGEKRVGAEAVIAPGSGLGEAILFWDGTGHRPMPTEGGHCSFSPTTIEQVELHKFLVSEFQNVSWEHVLSGPGVFNIYRFFCRNQNLRYATSAEVTANVENDENCGHTVRLFFEILANEAANLALKTLPYGGLFIAGGIVPKILKYFDIAAFRTEFLKKDRMEHVLQKIPVTLILSEEVGIFGAAHYFELKRPIL